MQFPESSAKVGLPSWRDGRGMAIEGRPGASTCSPSLAPTLAYVAGTGHTGSTLLSMVLNTHPLIVSIGEMRAPAQEAPSERRCSWGSRMSECPFYLEIARRLRREGVEFDPLDWNLEYRMARSRLDDSIFTRLLNRLTFGPLHSATLESIREAAWMLYPSRQRRLRQLDHEIERFVLTALDLRGARVLVDANKHPIRIDYLRGLKNLRLKVLHLVRDPRAFAHSVMAKGVRKKGAGALAMAWCRCQVGVERYLAKCPPGTGMLVRYESLCTEPEKTLAEIGEFLGVGPIALPGNYRGVEHHIMGNHMRLPSDERRHIQPDERWKRGMAAKDVKATALIAGFLARKYGYEI